jgi:hypothetical protein
MSDETDRVLVSNASFVAHVDGDEVLIASGQQVRADHPVVEGREHLFDEADAAVLEKDD